MTTQRLDNVHYIYTSKDYYPRSHQNQKEKSKQSNRKVEKRYHEVGQPPKKP